MARTQVTRLSQGIKLTENQRAANKQGTLYILLHAVMKRLIPPNNRDVHLEPMT